MSNKINLTDFTLRPTVKLRDSLVAQLKDLGIQKADELGHFRSKVLNLSDLLEVVTAAKKANLVIELPQIPEKRNNDRWSRKTWLAFDKHDAVNMCVFVLSSYGMTAGLAATFSGHDLTNVLRAFAE